MVLEASVKHAALCEAISPWIDPIELNSEKAKSLKEDFKKHIEPDKNFGILGPSHIERITSHIESYENNPNAISFRMLLVTLATDEDQLNRNDLDIPNAISHPVTGYPGWTILSTENQSKILEFANDFVLKVVPGRNAIERLQAGIITIPEIPGYKAIELLYLRVPQAIEDFLSTVWEEWAPVVVSYPDYGNVESQELQKELIRIAHQKAPISIAASISEIVRLENERYGRISILDKIRNIHDNSIDDALVKHLKDQSMKLESMDKILEYLLKHDVIVFPVRPYWTKRV